MAPKILRGTLAEPRGALGSDHPGQGLYEGEYRGDDEHRGYGTPHGWGTLTYIRSSLAVGRRYLHEPHLVSYEGEWTEGAPHGKGILTLASGTSYEGEWEWHRPDRSPAGAPSRDVDWSTWVRAKRWKLRGGRGTKTLPDGTRCEGEWRRPDDKSDLEFIHEEPQTVLHGQGTETWPDGTRYEGEWREGKLHKGSLTLHDGTRYEGEWQAGYFDRSAGGHRYVSPVPPDGMRDPAYRLRSKRDSGDFYERDFDNLYGRGTLTGPDGTCSQGEWRNGKLHGQGTESWSDGEQYRGEFRYGAPWRGTLTMPDGARVEYRYGKPVVSREP